MAKSEQVAETTPEQAAASEGERLKAVRDLIFGEDMAAYQQEFSQLRDQIQQNLLHGNENLSSESSTLNEKLDALEFSFNKSLKGLKQELDATADRLDQVNNQVNANRKEMGDLFATLSSSLLNSKS